MRISSIYSVLAVTASVTTATIALLGASPNIAIAQISSMSEEKTLSENSISQVNVLFVNPSTGNDQQTNGDRNAPFKTITQALKIAKDNTLIKLAKGTYSPETGERFPLILKRGISIEGDARSKGKGITIQGGGEYLSRYYGSKNIAIVATDNSKLTGVTVTNSNPRGYGMWIESKNPFVEQNTFTGSTQDGVAVTGRATPKIHKNDFYRNGANGITISGKSQPEIKENTFVDTGFGVNIAQNASPQVISNQISQNRTGVVVQAASSPVLRNNKVFNNKEDGLVVIAKAKPDLGNSSSPGSNQFSLNGRYDINAEAAKQEIAAYGNTFMNKRVAGKVNVTASAAPAKATLAQLPRPKPRLLNPLLPSRNTAPLRKVPKPSPQEELNYVEVEKGTIEFAAPEVASRPIAARATQPPLNTPSSLPALKPAPRGELALLPVPRAKIPVSRNGNRNIPSSPKVPNNRPQTQATRTGTTSGYRVIVEAVTSKQQELVKFIVPDAFRTTRRGKRVMQAGIFENRDKANSLIRIFKNNGLKARIE